jgi:hypothetical protein
MDSQTLGTHKSTYDAVFQHPMARNLQWKDVKSMLETLADTTEDNDGVMKFTRNKRTLVLHTPRRKDFSDVESLMKIRHFLAHSEAPIPEPVAEGVHLLVVLDHREARIFKTEMHGSVPQRILAYNANDGHRHLHHVEADSNGQRKPEPKAYYDAIARTLADAQSILIMGSSTGGSSAMEHLAEDLKKHHPALAKRIAGTVVINEQHMSEDQLLAEARTFYAGRKP